MLDKVKKVHILACGGIGMSALVILFMKKGISVSGSDQSKSKLVNDLINHGLKFISEIDPLDSDVDLVVVSSAISHNHPQLMQARAHAVPVMHRSEALNEFMKGKKPLLVAGTHGKTTTSSILLHVLKKLGTKPSYAIGGTFSQKMLHADLDEGDYFVAEADESDGSFLQLSPYGIIVTNIDQDHMDFWGNKENLEQGFLKFMNLCSDKKLCVYFGDDPILSGLGFLGTTYGVSMKNDTRLLFDQCSDSGREFLFRGDNQVVYKGSSPLNGHHNALNCLSVFTLLVKLGFTPESILEALTTFEGVDRRCQIKGYKNKTLWIDDYGHHPTEIQHTLKGLKEKYHDKKLKIIFQPHRYTRTYDLWDQMHLGFSQDDDLIITDIYGSSEANTHNLHAQKLAEDVSAKLKSHVSYIKREDLKFEAFNDDVVITFGAGDITHLFHEI
jgi:UDP-N-acetylmuramate--alanine ligase